MGNERSTQLKIAKERNRLLSALGAPELAKASAKSPPSGKESLAAALGLISQAAQLRIMLDDLSLDLMVNGYTEEYQRSSRVPATTRERPEVGIYQKNLELYQSIVKQLCGLLPEDKRSGAEELLAFTVERRRG